MTEADRTQIIALWDSRVPMEQIYRLLPYSGYRARKMVAELRADGTLKPRSLKRSAIEAVCAAWKSETKNVYELAEMFGYSRKTIQKYLLLGGCSDGTRPAHNHKKRTPNGKAREIAQEIERGVTVSEITRRFGVSRQYVHQIKKRMESDEE